MRPGRTHLNRFGPPALVAGLLLCACGSPTPTARFFTFDANGTLDHLADHVWQRHWHSVVSAEASDGTPLLVFYDREQGRGRSFRYDSSGAVYPLATWNDWNRDWDWVVSGDFGTFNTVFYRRTDGFLRGWSFTASGGRVNPLEQYIADPEPSVDPKGGWDIVVSGRFGCQRDGLLLYRRVTGTARFLRYHPPVAQFVTAQSYSGWRRTWDDIASGDFDGDGCGDLVLYDRDGGLVKIVNFDEDHAIVGELDLADAGRTHGAQLVVGNFGGSGRDDVLLYQNDNGQDFENGNARVWTDDEAGNRSLTIGYNDWQDRWTHVFPLELGAERDGFVTYSNQHVIFAGIYRMVPGPAGPYAWTAAERRRLRALEAAMRKTFAPAGLLFVFDILDQTFSNPTLANWECGAGHDRVAANQWVMDNVPPYVLPITLATAATGGGGCSNFAVDFVRTGANVSSKEKHFGHEVGHYLGLPHSHGGWATRNAVESFLSDLEMPEADRYAVATDLDRDDTANDAQFLDVFDTPPTLRDRYWDNESGSVGQCSEGESLTFTTDGGTDVTMWISPHDVMAYNNCNDIYRLTRDQVRVVRQTLYAKRRGLIGLE